MLNMKFQPVTNQIGTDVVVLTSVFREKQI